MSRERTPGGGGTMLAIVAIAVLGVVLARLVSRFALNDVPHVMDEIAYTLQAKTFASGQVKAALHLPRGAFAMWFVDDRAGFFSIFPPGWPALLSLGYLTGLASWVNPVLHGITTLLVARSARALAGARTAIIAAALYALSPQAILLAASFMSHTLVALAAAIVLVAGLAISVPASVPVEPLPRGRRASSTLVAAGAAVGVTAATRPLCAVVLFLVLVGFVIIALRRRMLRASDLARIAVPVVACLALLATYNARLTGNALRFPQTAYFDEHIPPVDLPLFDYHPGCNQLGFGPGHGCETAMKGGHHTLVNAASNLGDNMTSWLALAGGGPLAFGLALVALLVAVLGGRVGASAGASGAARRPLELLATFAALPAAIVLYGLYWYAGTCYGARFYHVALPSLLLLAAVGLERVTRSSRVLFVGLLVPFLVWNAAFGLRAAAEVSHSYWGTDARFARFAAGWKGEPALVLVAFAPEDLTSTHTLTTFMKHVVWLDNIRALGALATNRPDLSGPLVFARYHPALMPELRSRFPDRTALLYVAHARASADRVIPYETSALVPLESTFDAPPLANFDGFVIPDPLGP